MNPTKKILKRSKFISLEAISFALRPLQTSLISLLIIRLFSPELWGKFVTFLVAIEILNTILNWGQKPFLVREFSLSPKEISAAWYKAGFARSFLLVILVVGVLLFPFNEEYKWPFILWVISKWISSMFDALVQYHRKYTRAIYSEVLSILLALLMLYFFRDGMTLGRLILIFGIAGFVKLLALLPLIPAIRSEYFKSSIIKAEFILALPFFALTIAGLIQSKGDLYVVTLFLKDSDIAFYQVAIGFLILGQSFSAIVLGPFQKNIYRFLGNSLIQMKRTYLLIGFSASSIFSLALYILLKYFYQFEIELYFIGLFVLYLIPLYFYLIESQILLKHKLENDLLKYTVFSGLSNLTLSFLLVPYMGILGALLSGIVCRVILATLVVVKSTKITNANAS